MGHGAACLQSPHVEGLGGGGFLAMLDIVQKFLNGLASVAVFSQIYKLAYRKRVVFQINALVSTKSLTPGLAATCQHVVPVEKSFRRVSLVYVGERIQESLDICGVQGVSLKFYVFQVCEEK